MRIFAATRRLDKRCGSEPQSAALECDLERHDGSTLRNSSVEDFVEVMSLLGPAEERARRFRADGPFGLRVGTIEGPIVGAIIFFELEDRFGATGV